MTSPIATIALTFDGIDLQRSDLQVFLEIVHGLNETPSVRGTDTIVPGLAGRIEGNRVNDVLPITLEGLVRADPTTTTTSAAIASFRDNMQSIRTLFASNRARANLVATLEDGTTATISARPLPGIIANDTVKSEFANVSIELEGSGDWT
jgi:hypothetical protein